MTIDTSSIPTAIRPPSMGGIRTTVVSSPQDMAQYAEAWDELLLQQPAPLPMSSSAWIRSHAEHLTGPGEETHCLLAHIGDRLVGILPLVTSAANGKINRILSAPCGQHARSIDMVLAPDCAAPAAETLLDRLQSLCPRWRSFILRSVPAQSLTLGATDALGSIVSWADDSGRGAYVNTCGDYKTYLDTLSHNFSRNLRRARTRLDKDYLVEFQSATARPESVNLLEEFLELEASGWKGSQGTAIKGSPALHQFYLSLTERLAERGWLEYHCLTGDGRIMAAHLAVRLKRTVILLKIAYNEQFSTYAPGNMLMQEVIRRSFEDPDIDEVNCLTDMAWNTNWKMCYHGYRDVTLFPRRPLSMLTGYYPQVLRDRLRQIGPIRAGYRWLKQRLHR